MRARVSRNICLTQRRAELVAETVAGSAGTGAQGATELDHELRNDAVENQSIVERAGHSLLGLRILPLGLTGSQSNEVGDRLGGLSRLAAREGARRDRI